MANLVRQTSNAKGKAGDLIGAVISGIDESPKTYWVDQHRLPPGVLPKVPPDSILAVAQELRHLEFLYYIQSLVNREAWREYDVQLKIAEELGEVAYRPVCPYLFEWIGEFNVLSYDLIGDLTLPQLLEEPNSDEDKFKGSVRPVAVDWEQLVAWKADVELAVAQLSKQAQLAFRMARQGLSVSKISRELGIPTREGYSLMRKLSSEVRRVCRSGDSVYEPF